MQSKKNASRRWIGPDRRQTETIAAEQLIPQLHCITSSGGVQAASRRSYPDRLSLYKRAKQEFSNIIYPCSYEAFIHAIVEALRI